MVIRYQSPVGLPFDFVRSLRRRRSAGLRLRRPVGAARHERETGNCMEGPSPGQVRTWPVLYTYPEHAVSRAADPRGAGAAGLSTDTPRADKVELGAAGECQFVAERVSNAHLSGAPWHLLGW